MSYRVPKVENMILPISKTKDSAGENIFCIDYYFQKEILCILLKKNSESSAAEDEDDTERHNNNNKNKNEQAAEYEGGDKSFFEDVIGYNDIKKLLECQYFSEIMTIISEIERKIEGRIDL